MSERQFFHNDIYPIYGLYLTRSLSQAKKIEKMEIFDVFSMNGIENYPAAGEIFLENVILKVSQTPQGGA